MNGQGTYIYSSGDKYDGEFKDGVSHDQGISNNRFSDFLAILAILTIF
jgi:hypothetical protein